MSMLYLIVAMLLNVVAHTFAKGAALQEDSIIKLVASPLFFAMGISFGTSLIFWILALRNLPLSIAHPVFASTAVIVQLVAMNIFSEKVSGFTFALVALGIACLAGATFLSYRGLE